MKKTLGTVALAAALWISHSEMSPYLSAASQIMDEWLHEQRSPEYQRAWQQAEKGPWVTTTISPGTNPTELFDAYCIPYHTDTGLAYRNQVIARNPNVMHVAGTDIYMNAQTPKLFPGPIQMINRCKQ